MTTMRESRADTPDGQRSKYHIIDADAHTYNPKDMWERYLPKKYEDQWPHLVKDHAGGDAWLLGEGLAPTPLGLTFSAGKRYEEMKWYGVTYDDIRPACYEGKARLEDMDTDGIDAEVLYSDNRTMSAFIRHPDPEFQLSVIQGYNNWLWDEFCAPDPDRLIGMAQMPNVGIDGAIAELRRCKEAGIKGVIIRNWPSGNSKISPDDDPFWAACEELEMPVCNHGFAVSLDGLRSGRRFEGPSDGLAVAGVDQVSDCIVQIIATGVHDRFPELHFGAIETQAGWIPWLFEQMDDKYFRNRTWGGVHLQYLPSEYWTRNWFVTFITDQYGVRNRDAIGVENMMWSSDFPHNSNDWPYSRKVIQTMFAGVSDADREKIICGNAARVFHLS
jgi:predicted TIM-barrel fold metal-dependent hydrolase